MNCATVPKWSLQFLTLHNSNPICPVEFRVHILALPTYFGCKSAQGPNAFPIVAPLLTTLAQLDCASEVVFQ
jgi:hypothetical protein